MRQTLLLVALYRSMSLERVRVLEMSVCVLKIIPPTVCSSENDYCLCSSGFLGSRSEYFLEQNQIVLWLTGEYTPEKIFEKGTTLNSLSISHSKPHFFSAFNS